MKLCRFRKREAELRVGLQSEPDTLLDLTSAGVARLDSILESENPVAEVQRLWRQSLPHVRLADVQLCAPVDQQEVWAAGVTYARSKTARMEESDFSATAYDRVYAAERPELFFKSLPEKVVGPAEAVGIRADSRWSVPEPELALVMNSKGKIVGQTIGLDMSSRDIEGENLLYLPQAKIYEGSCALGPWLTLGAPEPDVREWEIHMEIRRASQVVFRGETSVAQIKRGFDELAGFLFRSQKFPRGAILLTGTGIVPPDSFTLAPGDKVTVWISGVGTLENTVKIV